MSHHFSENHHMKLIKDLIKGQYLNEFFHIVIEFSNFLFTKEFFLISSLIYYCKAQYSIRSL